MPDKKPRVVFDCMVFLQGLLSKSGPAVSCLRLFEEEKITLIVSKEILIEIQDVLLRSSLRRKYPLLTENRVEQLLELLRTRAEVSHKVPQHFRYERDPDDEPYVNVAIEARAEYLVSWDKDLLALGDKSKPEGKLFQEQFPNLKIVNPVLLLKEFEKDLQEY